jgi:pantoate--beta-alanine ligase
MPTPRVIADANVLREEILSTRTQGRHVGLVPTMGALHAGHVSLVEAARRECDLVAVTIFVNPTQFGPGEDFERYPRVLDRDLELLARAGCDLVFTPSVETMYPAGCETTIDVGAVAGPWEGERRPGHFAGVATIVMKLFQLAPASVAYFGRKDYQQTLVIARMVADLNVPIEVRVCPTVREPDGLAMSSRNAYLSPDERRRATALWAGLKLAQDLYADGERAAGVVRRAVVERLEQSDVRVDYVAVVREGGVDPVETLHGPTTVAIAGWVGKTRLIDNAVVGG